MAVVVVTKHDWVVLQELIDKGYILDDDVTITEEYLGEYGRFSPGRINPGTDICSRTNTDRRTNISSCFHIQLLFD